ncbi:cyclin-G-associated kinase-like isoform X2 [Varroa jacobsoni]|uniref:cyclin-G-associated kinase-like isoform X2 n=1 Tax=Varroa jacobsoni TaxID=62625 RepID=UPI000BF81A32|nr:cyclin-G-associated kinase-like isoform X2 [Varroa jacobsoni]
MFKSALGYFSGAGSSASKEDNEFVGQIVSLGIFKLRVLKVIAEGGFGFVFLVQDTNTGKSFALKRMFSVDQESADSIEQEIRVLKQLKGHPNVIEFCASAVAESQGGRKEYLILTEFCSGGVVVDAINKAKLSMDQVLKVFYQCCKAVLHMHTQQPPITHRDLKLENLLIARDGTVKLCDFGSSTIACHIVDDKWTALKRSLVEDEIQRNTTPMYRGPECLDTYNNFPIDHRLDVWALGCILYVLCYRQHPFADAAKLAILNAKYNIPANADTEFGDLQQLIGDMLTIDPRERPSVNNVLHRLEVLGKLRGIELSSAPFLTQHGIVASVPVAIDPVLDATTARTPGTIPEGVNLMNTLREGAGSFFKKLGDTSSKVIQIAQQSIGKSELDMHYITNRIAVMSYPAEGLESTYRNHIEDVRAVLEARHQNNYMVVNISGRSYTNNKFPGIKVIERLWNQKKAPEIDAVLELCHTIYVYLSGKRNAVVIHCLDGKAVSAQLFAAFMLYCRVFTNPKDALSMFAVKRFPVSLSPAQMRYLQYFYNVIRHKAPHGQLMEITRVTMRPPPLFTKVRDGCRPFVNIYVKDECVYSTCLEYEKLTHFSATAGNVDFDIPRGLRLFGDVAVVLNHARASTFAKGRIQAVPMATIQLFTGYIDTTASKLTFDINQLDLIEEVDRYSGEFEVVLQIRFVQEEVQDPTATFNKFLNITTQPKIVFSSEEEMSAAIDQFKSKNSAPTPSRPPPPSAIMKPAAPAPPPGPSPPLPRPDAPLITTDTVESSADLLNLDCGSSATFDSSQAPSAQSGTISHSNKNNYTSTRNSSNARTNCSNDGSNLDLLSSSLGGMVVESFSGAGLGKGGGDCGSRGIAVVNSTTLLFGDVSTASNELQQSQSVEDTDPFGLGTSSIAGTSSDPLNGHSSSNQRVIEDLFAATTESSTTVTEANDSASGDLFGQWNSFMSAPTPLVDLKNLDTSSVLGVAKNCFISELSAELVNENGCAEVSLNRPQSKLSTLFMGSRDSNTGNGLGNGMGALGRETSTLGGSFSLTANNQWTPRNASAQTTGQAASLKTQSPADVGTRLIGETIRKPVGENAFGDLLGTQGFVNFGKKDIGPRTMAEMKRVEMAKEIDPVRLVIYDWTKGKERNIRALLCSLHSVVWSEARWAEIGMHELVGVSDVKKMYRKACLAVHPDKLAGTDKEELAKLIFMELNDAWSEFEKQQNLA